MSLSKSHKISFILFSISIFLFGCSAIKEARVQQDKSKKVMHEDLADKCEFKPIKLASTKLSDLVAFAMTNRPAMVSAALAVKDARLQLKSIAADAPLASKTPWSALDANLSLGYSESSSAEHFKDFDSSTERGSASSSLSLDLLLYDFGRNDARQRSAAEKVIAAELELIQEGYKVFYEVASAYFTLMCNEALCEVASTNITQYATHLAQAEDRYEQGYAQKLDILRAKLDLARAQEGAVAASNDVDVAGANLVAYLGINAAQGKHYSVLGGRLGGLDRVMRGFNDSTGTVESVFADARINAPVLKIARARLRAASADVDYAIADLKPNISASLSLNWTDPLWMWRWGLSSVQSLFTGWRKTTALERATLALKVSENQVASAELQLSRNLEVALAERDNAKEAEKTANESLIQARENLETVLSQYEVEEVSRIEFTDAVSSYTEALGNRVKSFYRGQMAEAALFELIGMIPQYNEENVMEKRK